MCCCDRMHETASFQKYHRHHLKKTQWQKVVRRTRSYVGNSLFTSEPNHHGSLRASLRRQPVISTGEQNACLKNQFTSLSRQEHQKGGPIIPDHLTDICLASQNYTRWKKFWRKLYKQEWLHHNDFSAVHLFNFGSYVPLQFPRSSDKTMRCHFCLQSLPERLHKFHIYSQCETAKFWWKELQGTKPMALEAMLAPTDMSFHNLRQLNWFFKVVRITYRQRYNRSRDASALEPLLQAELTAALKRIPPMGRWQLQYYHYDGGSYSSGISGGPLGFTRLCQTRKIWVIDGFSLSDIYMYRAFHLIEFNKKKKKKSHNASV